MTSNKPARLSAIHPAAEEPAGGATGAGADRVDQAGEPAGRPGDGSADLIEQLRTSVLALLSGLDREPSSLRVRADQVEIAMEWPVAGTVTAAVPVAPAPATVADADGSAEDAGDSGHYLTAQMVGVFYRAPEPGARPFVEEGDQVSAGQQVGIIEAMKLMIPVEADVDGRIVRALADNAEPVEFGAKLFEIEVAESAGA